MNFLCKTITVLSLLSIVTCKLVQVVQIFRHGARYPLSSVFDGEHQRIDWGELIPSGMRQHYNLGRQLRKEYIEDLKLLSPTFNHSEFYIRSTDVNRTIMSAQSQLMGMFPNGPQLPTNIDSQYLLPPYLDAKNYLTSDQALPNFFQPIPIHIEPYDYQVLESNCQGVADLKKQDKLQLAAIILDFEVSSQVIRENICRIFNVTNSDCNTGMIFNLYGVYVSDLYQGKPVPQLTEDELDQFILISSFKFYYGSAGTQYSRYISKPFFNDVFKHLSKKIADPQSALKWVSYSAHDSNVIIYARTLNISSAECLYQTLKSNNSIPCQMQPPYATNIIFELHDIPQTNKATEQYFVKVKYNGIYQTICKNTEQCPYSQFKSLVEGSLATQKEFDQVCIKKQVTRKMETLLYETEQSESPKDLSTILILVQLTIILVLTTYILIKKQQNQKNEHLLVPNFQIIVE